MLPTKDNVGRKKEKSFRFWLFVFSCFLLLLFLIQFFLGNKQTWKKYKIAMRAKGESLDYKDFIPPPIPDEENMLKTPIMERWMYRMPRGSHKPVPVIDLPQATTIWGDWPTGKATDLVEWKNYFFQEWKTNHPIPDWHVDLFPTNEILPVLHYDNQPLLDAISNLAAQANVKVEIDSKVLSLKPMPIVSFHWENLPARDVWLALLDNHGLAAMESTNKGSVRIVCKPSLPATGKFFEGGIHIDAETYSNGLNVSAMPTNCHEEVMPLIVITEAPFWDAIQNLARQACLNIQFDIAYDDPVWQEKVSFHWEDITAVQALQRVLLEHHVMMQFDPRTKIGRVMNRGVMAQEVLDSFKQFEPQFEELFVACQRPKVRFDFKYEEDPRLRDYLNNVGIRKIGYSLQLVASAEVALGQSEAALRKIQAIACMTRVATSDLTLLGTMIGVSLTRMALQPVWDGLAAHRWNDEQLRILQREFDAINLISPIRQSLRVERAAMTYSFEHYSQHQLSTNVVYSFGASPTWEEKARIFYIRYAPQATLERAQIAFCDGIQTYLDAIDAKGHTIAPRKMRFHEVETNSSFLNRIQPDWTISFHRALREVAMNQAGIGFAVVGCALERYRLSHNEYPEKLDDLVPQFIETLPHDIINGQPLKYRRENKNHFTLYSVGWNERDDQGVYIDYRTDEDWVWQYP